MAPDGERQLGLRNAAPVVGDADEALAAAAVAISMRRAPASSAFSTSSFTTLAGRSTTSPAAIWSIRVSVSWRIGIRAPSAGILSAVT